MLIVASGDIPAGRLEFKIKTKTELHTNKQNPCFNFGFQYVSQLMSVIRAMDRVKPEG